MVEIQDYCTSLEHEVEFHWVRELVACEWRLYVELLDDRLHLLSTIIIQLNEDIVTSGSVDISVYYLQQYTSDSPMNQMTFDQAFPDLLR